MAEKKFTEKDLVIFGNYLLSKDRKESISKGAPVEMVNDVDLEKWQPLREYEPESTGPFCFGKAIEAAKAGKKIARGGWNGKGMFLYHVPANEYPAQTEAAKQTFPSGIVPYGAYLAMKTVDNTVVPWLASQTDVLAEDWVVIE